MAIDLSNKDGGDRGYRIIPDRLMFHIRRIGYFIKEEKTAKMVNEYNIYQQMYLSDMERLYGRQFMMEYIDHNPNTLKDIYSLSSCLSHRKELHRKKMCENIVPMSIGDSDFDADDFITFEKKAKSIEEYSLYRELYDEHYRYLLDSYRPWEYEDEFCIVKPPEDITELLRVCNYDDQGNQWGPFINRFLHGELRVLLAKERNTGKVIEYYYILDNNMICVTMQEEGESATASIAERYAECRNLTILLKQKDFEFREDSFLEALTVQYNMGRRV